MVNKLYLIGGYHGSVKHSPILELYNSTSEWKEVESAIGSFSREYHMGLLADDKEKTFFCGWHILKNSIVIYRPFNITQKFQIKLPWMNYFISR